MSSKVGQATPPLRVVVLDRNRVFAEATAVFLRTRAGMFAEGGQPRDAISKAVDRSAPGTNAALIDAGIDANEVAEIVSDLRRECPGIRIVLLLSSWSAADSRDVRILQPDGVLTRLDGCDGLLRVLHASNRNPDHRRPSRPPARADRLTEREREILQLLARGGHTKDIAARLDVSPHTVRTHVQRILRKLKVTSRAGAVAVGLSRRLVDPVEPST